MNHALGRALDAGGPVADYGTGRRCEQCDMPLSRYNPTKRCSGCARYFGGGPDTRGVRGPGGAGTTNRGRRV